MTLRKLETRYLPEENVSYARYYPLLLIAVITFYFLLVVAAGMIWYYVYHRPTPQFIAVEKTGQKRIIYGTREPNLLRSTIIRFATQAAVRAYHFTPIGNVDYLKTVRPYFTANGWSSYIQAIGGIVDLVEANKLFAYGIIDGTPLIANQGNLPSIGYAWRVQIPFLAISMSAEQKVQEPWMVFVTIIRVPTYISPQGIGIEKFEMVKANAGI